MHTEAELKAAFYALAQKSSTKLSYYCFVIAVVAK